MGENDNNNYNNKSSKPRYIKKQVSKGSKVSEISIIFTFTEKEFYKRSSYKERSATNEGCIARVCTIISKIRLNISLLKKICEYSIVPS